MASQVDKKPGDAVVPKVKRRMHLKREECQVSALSGKKKKDKNDQLCQMLMREFKRDKNTLDLAAV